MRLSPADLKLCANASDSMASQRSKEPQSTTTAGLIQLTTTLVHASGEWMASDWPVCPTSQTNAPHLMGAALSYARRYALFALVGIAGEDDLDAPDLLTEPPPASSVPTGQNQNGHRNRKAPSRSVHKPSQSILAPDVSSVLRDELIVEINNAKWSDGLALWAHRRLTAKNTLTADDARAVESAYLDVLKALDDLDRQAVEPEPELPHPTPIEQGNEKISSEGISAEINHPSSQQMITPLPRSTRARNKAHLRFVAAQPCLVCQRAPSDAHHLKFAEPRALGRKVSDQFTVPLCREHHQELHRHGDERAWWANVNVTPLEVARVLWEVTTSGHDNTLLLPDAALDASGSAAMK